jgi:SAM-dependent methyltransferase
LSTIADVDDVVPRSGRAIDVACGLGAQSIWLAQRGLSVVALDVSIVAVEAVRRAAVSAGLADLVETRHVDLDDGLPCDLLGVGDVVVCQRFRPPHGYRDLVEAIRPAGVGIVTVLSAVGADAPGPFHAPPGELRAAFADQELLTESEADGVASIVFRRT